MHLEFVLFSFLVDTIGIHLNISYMKNVDSTCIPTSKKESSWHIKFFRHLFTVEEVTLWYEDYRMFRKLVVDCLDSTFTDSLVLG